MKTSAWRFFSLLTLAIISHANAHAERFNFTYNDIKFSFWVTSTEERTVNLVGCNTNKTRIEIPETVIFEGLRYTVIRIAGYVFEGERLTKITLPETITELCDYSFSKCDMTEPLKIPKSVTTIGDRAFYQSKMDIAMAEGNTSYSCIDGLFLSDGGKRLVQYVTRKEAPELLTIPQSVREIAAEAFPKKKLQNLRIPESVTKIGESAFKECTFNDIEILGAIGTKIGESAFEGCSFNDVKILGAIDTIKSNTFKNTV